MWRGRAIGMFLVFILFTTVITLIPVHASTISGDVPVSYTPQQIEYKLDVDVRGQGQVIDGAQSIQNGVIQYTFTEVTEKDFEIRPDFGYHVKKILLLYDNGRSEELKSQIMQNKLTIHVNASMRLIVEFEKVQDMPGLSGENDNQGSSGSITGDETDMRKRWLLLFGSGAALIILFLKEKEQKWMHIKG